MTEEYIIEQKSGIVYNPNPIPICIPDSTTITLKKIRAEIDEHCSDNRDRNDGLYIAMKIIDKHLKEYEDAE